MLESFQEIKKNKWQVLLSFAKYQLITKLTLFTVFYPLYNLLVNYFFEKNNRFSISSGDYVNFILSFNGIIFLIFSIIFFAILIAIDINSFLIMSSLIKHGVYKFNIKEVILLSIRSSLELMNIKGFSVVFYISLVFPLIGMSLTLGPLRNFEIPNFIMAVIYSNQLYLIMYVFILLMLSYLTFRLIFTLHFSLLNQEKLGIAIIKSWQFTKKHSLEILKNIIINSWKFAAKIIFIIIVAILVVLLINYLSFTGGGFLNRFILMFSIIITSQIISAIVFLAGPFIVLLLTNFFYDKSEETSLKKEPLFITVFINNHSEEKRRLNTKILLIFIGTIFLIFNLGSALITNFYFNDLFRNYKGIEVVAHRSGGNLGAENGLEGIKKAIENNIEWTEIDIQRTKDGHYILNHDATFNRLSNINKTSEELTLEEIKTLTIKNEFDKNAPAEPIVTLEEVVATTKGKIGLFLELKGKTADQKMVDDIVAYVKKENILDQVVLLSLDYNLINYIEYNYSDMKTGYLYFFALGNTDRLVSDYLIMEEAEATADNIDYLKEQNKQVVVWTVNTPRSINKYVNSRVDGIITDYPLTVKESLENRNKKTDLEIILDEFLGY